MENIKLTNGQTVSFIEKLTWGAQEKIRGIQMSAFQVKGADVENVKEKATFDLSASIKIKPVMIEVCIKKIVDKDEKEVIFTNEWLNSLDVEDGDKLFEIADKITNSGKK